MHTTAATVRAVDMAAGSVWPNQKKITHVSKRVAMVIPEIGLEDEPISPVKRDDTVTKRKPKTRIIRPPTKPWKLSPSPKAGMHIITSTMPRDWGSASRASWEA